MNRDVVERALIDAGAAPVEPSGPRLVALEQRVLANRVTALADGRPRLAVASLPPTSRGIALRRISLGAVAACIVALVVLSLAWFGNDDARLVVAAADDVELTLPDGSVVDAAPGRELPRGTKIDVGGVLVVDGVSYGPGTYEVTDRGVVAADAIVVSTTTTTIATAAPPRDRLPTTVRVAPAPRPSSPVTVTSVRPTTSVARDLTGDPPASTRPPRESGDTRPSTVVADSITTRASTRPVASQPDSSVPPTTSRPGDRSDATVATRPTTVVPTTTTTVRTRPTTTVGDRSRDR